MTPGSQKFVAYLRVSTQKQGKSGLGLEAQHEAVRQFVAQRGGRIIAPEFVEVETGKRNDRPELAKALKRCRQTGACLLVAKLDRLSRNVGFLMTLRDSGVDLAAADMPEANTLMFTVMAGVAQHEREAISARTKAALAAASERRKKAGLPSLGGYRAGAADIRAYRRLGLAAIQAKAEQVAEENRHDVEPLVRERLSLRAIAARLNENEIRSPRGKDWSAQAVKNLIARLGIDRPTAA